MGGTSRCLKLVTGVAAALLLAACTVGPDYVKPQPMAAMPASFKELEGWKASQPGENVIQAAWWEIFNDQRLNELVAQVAAANQDVAAAEAQFRQARALVQAARAGYFPTATTTATATRSRSSENLGSGGPGGGIISTDFQLPLDVSWEVDLWGRIRRTVESGRASAQASAADLAGVRLTVQTEVALNYFLLRSVDAQKGLLDETVDNYRKSLQLTRNRYNSGVAARSDVLLAETQLKSTEALALDLGVQRAQLEHAIAILIGQPPSAFSLPQAPLGAAPPLIPSGVPSELLERRPDIAGAERRMAAANAQIGVAEAAYYPTLQLSALGGFEASRLDQWLSWPSRYWAVGPAISETVFDGGLRGALTEQARAVYDATVASYRQAVLIGFQEVEDNLAALRILEEEARVQDEAVQAASRTVTVTTNQYQAGTVSFLNVLVAQTAELTSRRAAIDILGRRLNAEVLLIKALGGGWQAAGLGKY